MTLACAGAFTLLANEREETGRVQLCRLPEGAIQPQLASDEQGILHLVTFAGDPRHGNLFYAKSEDGGRIFSRALPVNSQPDSAIALGTIRGAQLALGPDGRVHVVWNGSGQAQPPGPLNPDSGKPGVPMLYTRLNDARTAFDPERNLMLHSFGLDGGGSIAADRFGNVFVAWHGIGLSEASERGKEGEERRRVWVSKSNDEGRSFSVEARAWPQETGACGCCGMKILADRRGNIFALYRSATESVHRDIYLLTSTDHGNNFQGKLLHKWDVNACPMSSMDFAGNADTVVAAWETGGQIYWTRVDQNLSVANTIISAPGDGKGRKHPRVALNRRGDVLLAWTEGTSWQRGGSLAYQLYSRTGVPLGEKTERPGIPAWSFGGVAARSDGGFVLIY